MNFLHKKKTIPLTYHLKFYVVRRLVINISMFLNINVIMFISYTKHTILDHTHSNIRTYCTHVSSNIIARAHCAWFHVRWIVITDVSRFLQKNVIRNEEKNYFVISRTRMKNNNGNVRDPHWRQRFIIRLSSVRAI